MWSSKATVRRSVVARTAPRATNDGPHNAGILANSFQGPSELWLQDSRVVENVREGVMVHGAVATIERTVFEQNTEDRPTPGRSLSPAASIPVPPPPPPPPP